MTNVTRNRWQVRIAALIIFVLGVMAGILALTVYSRTRPFGGGGNRFEELSDRLKLTPDQKTKVQEIFSDTREQIRGVRQEMEPKFNEIRRQADGGFCTGARARRRC